MTQIDSSSIVFQRDMRKEGWELIGDVGETQLLSPNQLELAPFLLKGKNHINGEELVKFAKKMRANLGQRQAEYLLKHQDEISLEWRQYYLIFPGTIWHEVRYGGRAIPGLSWDGGCWFLNFSLLDSDFSSIARLLRPRE